MSLEMKKPEVLNVRFRLNLDCLQQTSHLSAKDRRAAVVRLRANHARSLVSFGLRNRRPLTSTALLYNSGLGLKDLLRGLRGYL